jgi:hydroxyacylglutathione hydrolase
VLAGQPEPPKYFAHMKRVNKEGPAILGGFHAPPELPATLLPGAITGGLVIDTRPADEFAAGHLPGTLNIPLNSSFVTWAGWLLPASATAYLIVDERTATRLEEVVRGLALIGIDSLKGFFRTAAIAEIAARGTTLQRVPQIAAAELAARLGAGEVSVIDVRSANEWSGGHLPKATHIPLGYLADRLDQVPRGKPVVVQCQLGGRSAIAASLLQRLGVDNVIDLTGGYQAWTAAGLPTEGALDHAHTAGA